VNKKVKFLKHYSIDFGYLLEPCIETWRFFLNSRRILAIDNLKEKHNFRTFNFNTAFWLYTANKKAVSSGWFLCPDLSPTHRVFEHRLCLPPRPFPPKRERERVRARGLGRDESVAGREIETHTQRCVGKLVGRHGGWR
jgi:hypothetical protein